MLKIKKILIKIIIFKINYSNLIDFQKIIEGINFNINYVCKFSSESRPSYSQRKAISGLYIRMWNIIGWKTRISEKISDWFKSLGNKLGSLVICIGIVQVYGKCYQEN
jgi:hypothetical protein